MRIRLRHARAQDGMTLIEMMVVTGILASVILIVTTILLSSSKVQSRTMHRAEVQADARQTLSLMSTEIRQAGADPHNPPIGVTGIVSGDSISLHVRADLNGDGAIQTTEPSEDITYTYDPGAKTISRDPGSGAAILLSNVTAMSLSYFDSSNLPVVPLPLSSDDAARVHSIGLTLTSVDKDAQPLTLTARITLRNMGS